MVNPYIKSVPYYKIKNSINCIEEFTDIRSSKKIAIFSVFISAEGEFNYHSKIYNWLKFNGYAVILVYPKAGCIHLKSSVLSTACDVLIKRENFGYDFGSYASGLQFIEDFLCVENILFINDSCIGPFGNIEKINDSCGFWANTDSKQVKYHFQSYLFGFNLHECDIRIVFEFFFGRGDIFSNNKIMVINNFELSMYEFFSSKEIPCNVLHSIVELKAKFRSSVFNFIRMPHIVSKALYFFIIIAKDVNPTHQLWLELFKDGFPFIKKELFRDNPTKYPCLEEALKLELDKINCFEEYKFISRKHV